MMTSTASIARRQLAIIVAALLFAPSALAQVLQPAIFVRVSSSVVRVEAERQQSGLSVGSGVTVGPAIVVTNCHVTRNAATIRISGDGRLWEVTGQYADANHDLCFLRAPAWRGKPAVFGEPDSLQVGQAVAAIGFTGGAGRTLRFGRVQALHSLDGGRVIESDTKFTSGASGGGLFDASGALVGLLTFRMRGPSGSYYSLPVRWIRDRLPAEGQWTDLHPQPDAIPFWQRDLEALPYFMRAAPLYAEGRWAELIELTERWSAADSRDAEPLRLRGEAMQRLDRPEAAIGAYTEAVALGPDVPSAWYGLALAYATIGNAVASQRAGSRLADLDRDLAARLHDVIERLGVSP
jgi:tetratricopeptide (TPR) repeat protein